MKLKRNPTGAKRRGKRRSGGTPSRGRAFVALALAWVTAMLPSVPAEAQVVPIACPTGFGVGVPAAPPVLLRSLQTVANPILPNDPVTFLPTLRPDLVEYVADLGAALQLGKALFWEMQAGSDGRTACATCHFHAGADGRTRNQASPGPDGLFGGLAPNAALTVVDFPLVAAHAGSNDVVGSQGVRRSAFVGVSAKGVESTSSVADPVFSVGGKNVRRVTGKNSPSVINAVFNHRNFWNGRAQPEFNGVNPFGSRDGGARVWLVGAKGIPAQVGIQIQNASPASQAVGPVLSDVEMSAAGRTFPDVGRKLLALKPLALQKVDRTDGVLGAIADPVRGLTVTYRTLVQAAFQRKWWDTSKAVTVNGRSFSVMEANFSLYWGLSVMLYEATLVSDETPIDQYLNLVGTSRPGASHPTSASLNEVADRLRRDYGYTGGVAGILNGLDLFEQPLPPAGRGRECTACHLGPNLTSASSANLVGGGVEPGEAVLKLAGYDLRMERMYMQVPPVPTDLLGIMRSEPPAFLTNQVTFDPATYRTTVTSVLGTISTPPWDPFPVPGPARTAVYDAGWYNIGVRPTADDPGLDGTDPFGNSLSWTKRFQALADPSAVKVPGGGALTCAGAGNASFPSVVLNSAGVPLLSGPLLRSEETDVAGTFKTSALRNAELDGPYFHDGGKSTLLQVVDFYDGGGDFVGAANPTLSPLIRFYGFLSANGQAMLPGDQKDLVAFLIALTDERVRWERAPFDHPQLFVPNGDSPAGTDAVVESPATGASGAPLPLGRFLKVNHFTF